MSVDQNTRRFHVMILGLKGTPPNSSAWWDLTYAIGSAWQLGHLSDDEAKDLETMLRSYRFPKK